MDLRIPAYLSLLETGELQRRAELADRALDSCTCCAWKCRANRHKDKPGVCQVGALARVSSYDAHLGEVKSLSGWRGSGTIFFSSCNLRCQFCQNVEISQIQAGQEVSAAGLAEIMLALQERGCHNINLASPSHVIPQILAALVLAAQNGLRLPLVFNTSGYDNLAMLALLDGVIDIYLPDMKYADEKAGLRYSRIPHYPQANQKAVLAMYHQVGDLQLDENGLAVHGLLVRHLLLPEKLSGTEDIIRFLARKVSPHQALHVSNQYHPDFNAQTFPELNRAITAEEYQNALRCAEANGLVLVS
jgi:putative pyruvate formate lyase activating enzyme